MFIYWGSNIAGKTRSQAFMIKGQPFLNGYVSAILVVSALVLPITGVLTESIITGSLSESEVTGALTESIVTGVLS